MPTIPAQTFNNHTIPQLNFSTGITNSRTLYTLNNQMVDIVFSVPMNALAGIRVGDANHPIITIYATDNGAVTVSGIGTGYFSRYSYIYDNKTVYYYYGANDVAVENIAYNSVDIVSRGGQQYVNIASIAWLMVYGGYDDIQITYNLTNCTGAATNPTTCEKSENPLHPDKYFECEFTADLGYEFQGIDEEFVAIPANVSTLQGSGQTVRFRVIPILNPSSVVVKVQPSNVFYHLSGCSKTSGPLFASPGDVFNLELDSETGFQFQTNSVIVEGATLSGMQTISEHTYFGQYTVGNVTSVTITCELTDDPYSGLDGEGSLPPGTASTEPAIPTLSAVESGIIGLFKPTLAQMQQLADFMWTDFGGTASTTEDILKEIVQALKRSISNPLDYVIGLNIIPSQGLTTGSNKTVRFGYISSGVLMTTLSSQFFTVDCGSISFPPVCGDTFLDYAPYSKFSIYLPYIGFRELDANDCVGHTISVKYHGDAVTGALCAYIFKDGDVFYQFSGSCALSIPLTADGWGSTLSATTQTVTAIISGSAKAAAGGSGLGGTMIGGLGGALAHAASSVASNPSLLSPQVARSGSMGGAAGFLGVQTPFIIREAVSFHSTEGFNTIAGYPSYYYRRLEDIGGFTVLLDVHLHNVPALREEIEEIESLLKEGVYL